MDNNSFTSSNSIKPSSVTNPSFNDNNENEVNPEMASKLKKQQISTKNFMSATICTANKATVPKKKVLAERNETLDDVVEQNSLRTSFGSKSLKSPGSHGDDDVQKPYDPVNNYLSPRPKFLRYNPDRRRKLLLRQENEDKNSSSLKEFRADSSGFVDSCSQKESVEKVEDEIHGDGECQEDEESEDANEEEEAEEEMVEFGEDGGWNLMGFLKFLVAVIAVIATTQAICSMNSPSRSYTPQMFSDVNGVAGLNVSEVGSCSLMETEFVVGRLKEVDIVETIEGVYEVEAVSEEETSDSLQRLGSPDFDLESEEADVVHGEIWNEHEETVEIEESEVIEVREVDGEREVDDQILRADSDENEETMESESAEESEENQDYENAESAIAEENEEMKESSAKYEIAEESEKTKKSESEEHEIAEEMKEEVNDVETSNRLIRSESFDLNLAVLIGFITLILASFGVVYNSKRTKSPSPIPPTFAGANHVPEKVQIKVSEISTIQSSSLIQQINEELLVRSTSSQAFSQIHAPSVELLGEFVFGEEADHASNSLIQATSGEIRSSHMENSTGNSVSHSGKTVKKQRRKNVEATAVITPSPVRRSSRLQNRSIKSP